MPRFWILIAGLMCCIAALAVVLVELPGDSPALVLTATRQTFDCGQVSPDSTHRASFTIMNSSTSPLEITGIVTGCSCTTAVLGKRKLAAGDATDVEAEVTFGASNGMVAQRIELQYIIEGDVQAKSLVLGIEAEVSPGPIPKEIE